MQLQSSPAAFDPIAGIITNTAALSRRPEANSNPSWRVSTAASTAFIPIFQTT
jgi:hypothetical protein